MAQIEFNLADFEAHFERRPFLARHSLASHPLFARDRLIELAKFLPAEHMEMNAGDVPANLLEGGSATHGLSVAETIARIGELRTWVSLKKICLDPEYRALIDEILDTFSPGIDRTHPGMFDRAGFIFITSPRSVTPYHMDSEHNFLFHLQGRKEFTVWDQSDREVVTEEDLERFHTRDNRRLRLPEHLASRGRRFDLVPGDMLHVPVCAPHLVSTLDEVCISLSVTFFTPAATRRATLHALNRKQRRLRLPPSPLGMHPWRDRSKLAAFDAYQRLRGRRSPEQAG